MRSILVADTGQLWVIGRLKRSGDLPDDLEIKVSISLPVTNPASARLVEELGATTINLPIDLSLAQIAAIRQAVAAPLDVYVEGADDFGGAVRYYEAPELVRVAAPVHLKFTVRNAPGIYPSGEHLAGLAVASARERVRRAAIGIALLRRHYPWRRRLRLKRDHPARRPSPPDQAGEPGGHGLVDLGGEGSAVAIASATSSRAWPVPVPIVGRSGVARQDVVGQQQLDRQQVVQQRQRAVGLADAQRRAGAVVLDADVERRGVEGRGGGQLLELGVHGGGRVAQLEAVAGRRRRVGRRGPGGLHELEVPVPQVAHAALAELPDVGDGDPQGVEGDGQHHGVEVAVADEGLLGQRHQRVVAGRVELDLDRPAGQGHVLAQRPVDLGHDPERQRVLDRVGGPALQQVAAGQGAAQWSAASIWPGKGLALATAGRTIDGLPPVASIDRAAATSAAPAARAARSTTSPAWPIEMLLAENRASPSLASSTSGAMPARRRASPPGMVSPRYSARPRPIATWATPAIWAMSPAPTEARSGTTGWTPAFSMLARTSAAARLAPDPPRAMPLRRAARAARTCRVGRGAPTPPACVMTSVSCWRRSWSSDSRTSLPWPTWVVRP